MTVSEMKNRKKELGYTNAQLADLSGVPLGTVMKVLSGSTKSPRRETLLALEKALSPYHPHSFSHAAVTDNHTGNSSPADSSAAGNLTKTRLLKENSFIYGTTPASESGDPSSDNRQRLYTIEDYYALPDDVRTELIDGVFYNMSSPSVIHQLIIGEMFLHFKECEKKHHGECRIILSPCDVQLDRDRYTVLQPDILIVCDLDKIRGLYCFGAPDLTVEVLSPSNSSHDCILKLRKYQLAGVREYWIVDPKYRQVIVYNFEDPDHPSGSADSSRFKVYSFEDTIPVGISDGACSIDFKSISDNLKFLSE